MYVLGLSSYAHEASCTLLKDGEVRGIYEEERFNREKHTWRFPRLAIREALRREGIGLAEVDHVTFFWRPLREVYENAWHVVRHLPESLNLFRAPSGSEELSFGSRILSKVRIGQRLRESFDLPAAPPVSFVEHHLAHAASAFYVSPFEEAAILTLDGRGESTSTMFSRGRGTRIEKLREIKVPHSVGHLYAAVTHHLGFRPFFDEWKVMGMSAYGQRTYVKAFEDVIRRTEEGAYRLNLDYFGFHTHGRSRWLSEKFSEVFGPPRLPGSDYDQRHFDLALALQAAVEEVGVHLAESLRRLTGSDRLCLAGGVVLNCLMNKRILERAGFRDTFIQPIANDAGTSLGSALYHHHQVLGRPRGPLCGFESVYFGPEYTDEEIEAVLMQKNLRYHRSQKIAAETAALIAEGKIVGWFQGRMEAGPRALGNRSITVDPTDGRMKECLNERVKKREFFRPFAPSVLEERVEEYFRMPGGVKSPHMILVGDVREEKRSVIPAVTHADGTARVHTVSRATNEKYWELISEFETVDIEQLKAEAAAPSTAS
ncbi:MAG: carbamoyl transferase [Deltaproteobacteria bacterium]|nr:carbamoyl transferase [Deltaproteobacteria bacterium]